MKRIFLFVLFVGAAAAALTSIRRLPSAVIVTGKTTFSQASSAAFRDGLYLGRFDAGSGRSRHLCVGRWSSDVDRAWFTAGYQAGYQQLYAGGVQE